MNRAGRHPKEIILGILSQNDFISGESLGKQLGISRPAVGKYITQLKGEGFVIESLSGKGYRLKAVPDILYPDLIRQKVGTRYFGKHIFHFLSIDSTNIQARAMAADGAREGTLLVAEYQEKGKGRLNRQWQSPSGKNLLFSLILRPEWPPQQAFFGTVLASVSLCRAIEDTAGIKAGIKWPNDIYTNQKKLAGILTEVSADPDRIEYMVVGIGINCNWSPPKPPPDGQPATSLLKETGQKVSRLALLTRFLGQAEKLYDRAKREGVSWLREEWNHYSLVNNHRLTISSNQKKWNGVGKGIDDQGALILELDDGRQEKFLAGDVQLRFKKMAIGQKL
jgi:BirA family transcriptional regulator, biotin operon repressor / biotin---[acetyl-CoA-carboxylase] ligase